LAELADPLPIWVPLDAIPKRGSGGLLIELLQAEGRVELGAAGAELRPEAFLDRVQAPGDGAAVDAQCHGRRGDVAVGGEVGTESVAQGRAPVALFGQRLQVEAAQ
jgi:hypothetical protein